MTRHLLLALGLAGLVIGGSTVVLLTVPAAAATDVFSVTLDPAVAPAPLTGRLILFFVDDDERRYRRRGPARGPFWDPPQPMASVAVENLAPGGVVAIDGSAIAFPESIDALDGRMRVQAVLDVDDTERSHLAGPGNLLSGVLTVDLKAGREDHGSMTLDRRVKPAVLPKRPNLEWIDVRSDLLSAFYGRDVFHRAGVALPKGYFDETAAEARWPAVYTVPGFGGGRDGAAEYADMLATPNVEDIAPVAVWIVLDPEAPLGHHGFVDSPNLGPRGTALVTELIPHLEQRFRLVARPEARLVTGHSSGGWSALWLQVSWPETFGGCWASAPDPVDFRAFQKSNLYEDGNLYVDADGAEQPSYRVFVGVDEMKPAMTVRQECRMEYVLSPDGRSGQQWDTWEAMFSPRDPETGLPRPLFDPRTGRIHPEIADHWRGFDLSARVAGDWARYGPVVMQRVRLSCGELDSFYLDGAVRLFKQTVERLAEDGGGWSGPGYVRLVPDASHATLGAEIYQRVNEEMREHLKANGLDEGSILAPSR